MKKAVTTLVLTSFLAVLALPAVALAQDTFAPPERCTMVVDLEIKGETCAKDTTVELTDPNRSICCLINTVYSATNWIFIILIAVSVIFVLIGGITIMMSAGSPEGVSKGRNFILYAVIGIIVAFLAKTIPTLVRLIVA